MRAPRSRSAVWSAPIPNDPLAGNAQYWIGETYYVRGQYKNAADAFLKGYKKYKSSEKAPDTLLRLGMALAELGQKDAACSDAQRAATPNIRRRRSISVKMPAPSASMFGC